MYFVMLGLGLWQLHFSFARLLNYASMSWRKIRGRRWEKKLLGLVVFPCSSHPRKGLSYEQRSIVIFSLSPCQFQNRPVIPSRGTSSGLAGSSWDGWCGAQTQTHLHFSFLITWLLFPDLHPWGVGAASWNFYLCVASGFLFDCLAFWHLF